MRRGASSAAEPVRVVRFAAAIDTATDSLSVIAGARGYIACILYRDIYNKASSVCNSCIVCIIIMFDPFTNVSWTARAFSIDRSISWYIIRRASRIAFDLVSIIHTPDHCVEITDFTWIVILIEANRGGSICTRGIENVAAAWCAVQGHRSGSLYILLPIEV